MKLLLALAAVFAGVVLVALAAALVVLLFQVIREDPAADDPADDLPPQP